MAEGTGIKTFRPLKMASRDIAFRRNGPYVPRKTQTHKKDKVNVCH